MTRSRLVALVLAMLTVAACGGADVKQPGPPPEERKAATEGLTPGEETPTSGRVGLTSSLSGAAEVPKKGDPDGTGAVNLTLDAVTGQVCYTATVDKIAPPTAAHIHEGESGKAGPVVIPLQPPVISEERCFAADPALVQRIASEPGRFYANIHNEEFPDGAVRGQLQARVG